MPLVLPVMQKALPALRGGSRLRPGSILQSWHLSVHPTCHGCRRGSRKPVSGKVNHGGHGGFMRGDSSVRGEQSRRIAPYRRVRYLSVTASSSPAQGRWRHMTATSTVRRPTSGAPGDASFSERPMLVPSDCAPPVAPRVPGYQPLLSAHLAGEAISGASRRLRALAALSGLAHRRVRSGGGRRPRRAEGAVGARRHERGCRDTRTFSTTHCAVRRSVRA